MKKVAFLFLLFGCSLLFSCSKAPKTFEELRQAGENAYFKNQFPEARDYLGKAVTLNSSDKRALYLLGMSYAKDYIMDSAFTYLKRADILYPNDREISQAIYTIGPDLEEWAATLRAIAVLIKTGDKPESHYLEMAQLSLNDTNYVSAYFYFNKLREAQPDSPSVYLQLANTARLMDSANLAVALMDTAIAKFGSKEEFLSNKGVFLVFKQDYPGAEKIFRTLVAASPASDIYQVNLANVLASQNDKKKKEEALKLCLAVKPKTAQTVIVDSLIATLKHDLGE